MENLHFKTEYLSYWIRFRKQFLFAFLIISAIAFYSYFEDEQGSLGNVLIIVFGFGLIYGAFQLYNSRDYINEIKIDSDKLIIIGYRFNSRWEEVVEIKDSTIEIKSEGRGRGNVDYYFRVTANNKIFNINGSFNWDYPTLLTIFYEFKKIKGEKIIFDEKFYLDIMEKKANGFSNFDIFIGKDLKK